MGHYAQLTQEQRYRIEALIASGHSNKEVAEDIGVHPSTISRELRRNLSWDSLWGYCAKGAGALGEGRKRRPETRTSAALLTEAERLAGLDWSPEQVSGRLRLERGVTFSSVACRARAKAAPEQAHLRHGKPYRRRGQKEKRGRIPNQKPITLRPAEAEGRSETGHWEGDTIHGRGGLGVLVTLVDRMSRLLLAAPSPNGAKTDVGAAMVALLAEQQAPDGACRTITLDNGKEFAGHEDVSARLDTPVCFAAPYASWQRGTNENTNGLLREYFPKTRPRNATLEQVSEVAEHLNHRPRKTLGWRTPHEVHYGVKMNLTKLHL